MINCALIYVYESTQKIPNGTILEKVKGSSWGNTNKNSVAHNGQRNSEIVKMTGLEILKIMNGVVNVKWELTIRWGFIAQCTVLNSIKVHISPDRTIVIRALPKVPGTVVNFIARIPFWRLQIRLFRKRCFLQNCKLPSMLQTFVLLHKTIRGFLKIQTSALILLQTSVGFSKNLCVLTLTNCSRNMKWNRIKVFREYFSLFNQIATTLRTTSSRCAVRAIRSIQNASNSWTCYDSVIIVRFAANNTMLISAKT